MKVKDYGEFGLIELVSGGLINRPERVVKGIGDDTAVIKASKDKLLLFTTDMMIEGVHFSLDYSKPQDIGKKALAVNISDIAAMGGYPTDGVISIGVPGDLNVAVVEQIYAGIREIAGEYQVNIVGGDTVKSRDLIINVALTGEVAKDKVVYRSGAKPGDVIYVTGALGNSAAGLYLFQNPEFVKNLPLEYANNLKRIHVSPSPRLFEAQKLVNSGLITAMNDISDGLASELHEIGSQSNVGCELQLEQLPISQEVRCLVEEKKVNAINWALYGGEDFELVFTVKGQAEHKFASFAGEQGITIYKVGQIVAAENGFNLLNQQGEVIPFEAKGYNHFRSE